MTISATDLQKQRKKFLDEAYEVTRDEKRHIDIGIRLGEADDVPFIMRRTLQDLRMTDFCRTVQNHLYYTYMHRAMEHTLTRAVVKVAYPQPRKIKMEGSNMIRSSDPRRILGFLIADPTDIGLIVHYCYTRRSVNDTTKEVSEDYRKQGIAKKLIAGMMKDYKLNKIIYTQRSAQFRFDQPFRERIDKDEKISYNPWLFYTLLPAGWETGIR